MEGKHPHFPLVKIADEIDDFDIKWQDLKNKFEKLTKDSINSY
jgi:hypothetical protein